MPREPRGLIYDYEGRKRKNGTRETGEMARHRSMSIERMLKVEKGDR